MTTSLEDLNYSKEFLQTNIDKLRKGIKEIYGHTRNYLVQLENTPLDPHQIYYKNDVTFTKYKFRGGMNKYGNYIAFQGGTTAHVKISCPLIISAEEERILSFKYYKDITYTTLRKRIDSGLPAFDLFVDRVKVPPEDVKITVYDQSVDIYFHKKYFSKDIPLNENHEIRVSAFKEYNQFSTTNIIFEGNGSFKFRIPKYLDLGLRSEAYRYKLLRNGSELIYGVDFYLKFLHTDIEIYFTEATSSANKYELVYDPDSQLLWSGYLEGNRIYIPLKADEMGAKLLNSATDSVEYHPFNPEAFVLRDIFNPDKIELENLDDNDFGKYLGYITREEHDLLNTTSPDSLDVDPLVNVNYLPIKPNTWRLEHITATNHTFRSPADDSEVIGFNGNKTQDALDRTNGYTLLPDMPINIENLEVISNGFRIEEKELVEVMPRVIEINSEHCDPNGTNLVQFRFRIRKDYSDKTFPLREYRSYLLDYIKYKVKDIPTLEYLKDAITPDWVRTPVYPNDISTSFHHNPTKDNTPQLDRLIFLGNEVIHKDHPDYFKYIIKQFSKNRKEYYSYGADYTKYIRNDTSQECMGEVPEIFTRPHVLYKTAVERDLGDYDILVFVDGLKIKKSDVIIRKILNYVAVYIPEEYITNTSLVCLWLVRIYNREVHQKIFEVDEENNVIQFSEKDIGLVRKEEGIKLYYRYDSGQELNYLIKDEDYTLEYDEASGIYTATFIDPRIDGTVIVHNGSFYDYIYKYVQDPKLDLKRTREIFTDKHESDIFNYNTLAEYYIIDDPTYDYRIAAEFGVLDGIDNLNIYAYDHLLLRYDKMVQDVDYTLSPIPGTTDYTFRLVNPEEWLNLYHTKLILTNGEYEDYKYLPRDSDYTHLVFRNGRLLKDGTNYFYCDHVHNPNINISRVTMNDMPAAEDEYEIYFIEEYYENLDYEAYTESKYTLIYLERAVIPFDNNFIDVYVDGVFLDKNNIQVLNERLIRLRNVKWPNQQIEIKYNLDENLRGFAVFLDAYNNTDDLYLNWVLENYGDNLDDWYHSALPEEPENEFDPDFELHPYSDVILHYITQDWLKGGWIVDEDYNALEYGMERIIDANEDLYDRLNAIPKYAYLLEMTNESDQRPLFLDANMTYSFLDEDYVLDGDFYRKYGVYDVNWMYKQKLEDFRTIQISEPRNDVPEYYFSDKSYLMDNFSSKFSYYGVDWCLYNVHRTFETYVMNNNFMLIDANTGFNDYLRLPVAKRIHEFEFYRIFELMNTEYVSYNDYYNPPIVDANINKGD